MKKLDLSGAAGNRCSKGLGRGHASRTLHKAEMKLSSLKTTLLVDANGAIVDLHVTTTRKHDTKIAPSIVKRNSNWIDVLLGDKGYDNQKLRELCLKRGYKASNQVMGVYLGSIKNLTKSWKGMEEET